jgi:para-aminobenzoate synthetase component 1
MMAYRPRYVLKGKDQALTVTALNSEGLATGSQVFQGRLLDVLNQWTGARRAPAYDGLPDFCGGLLGFFSYDLVREIERLPHTSKDDLNTPDLYFLAVEQVLVYDHEEDQHWLVVYQPLSGDLKEDYRQALAGLEAWRKELLAAISRLTDQPREEGGVFRTVQTAPALKPQPGLAPSPAAFAPSFTREEFIRAVHRVKAYIAAGDVFQVNLSLRQSRPLKVHPLSIYAALRRINPSPYMGYLHFPDLQVVCGSPEQLIRLKDGRLNTRPIAGTRPRGSTQLEDRRLARELVHHQKERAEHVMLVDLERNDLGRVACFGSVRVTELMVLEAYSHVMHLVSNVEGRLAPGKNAFDVIRAVFPGGTITGAPKVRTMEIIEELEPVRRGVYTGSIGWLDYSGNMELNIVIRTLLVAQGWVHVQAGAGLVIDSVPEKEYQESLNKARALWQAVEESEAKRSLSLVEEE